MFVAVLYVGLISVALWAIGNIVLWRKNAHTPVSETYYFWQMNGYWNVVNLSIAIISAIVIAFTAHSITTNSGLQSTLIKLVAANIILDLLYVVGGLVFENRGKRSGNIKYRGYGASIQLQGAFLFFFDSMLALGLLIATL